jgi:hypothetical protein
MRELFGKNDIDIVFPFGKVGAVGL